jgi:uncharacterized membrane protein YphA (DoxX/SURF4 family)
MKWNWANVSLWLLRLLAAVIMFTAAEESIYIFTRLGMEPWGRILTGVLELVASLLILYPRATAFGALLGAGLMGGAIYFHLTKLGIVVKDDGGQLFIYALLVFISSCILLLVHRDVFAGYVRKVRSV